MSIARKILGNTFMQVGGRIVTAVLAVLVVKLLSVYLGKGGYGEYATIYEFLAFFGAIADMGLFTIAVREMSHTENKSKIFSTTLTLRTILATFAIILAVLTAFLIPKYEGTIIPLGVLFAGISVWFIILSGTISTILQVKLKMGFHALALIIGKIITVALIFFIAQIIYPIPSDFSFYMILVSGIIGSAVTFLITAIASRQFAPIKFSLDKIEAKRLLLEALPFGIALILNTIYFRMDIFLFSIMLPHSDKGVCMYKFCSDTEAGIYAVAVRMMEVLIIIPLFFMNSVLPTLTRAIKRGSENLRKILSYSFYFLLSTGSAGAIGIYILAVPIVRLISSNEFLSTNEIHGSDTAIRILMVAMFFTFLTNFLGFALIAFGHQKKLLWINLVAVIFNLFANFWAIPRYGVLGAGITSVISEAIILILAFIYLIQITKEFSPSFLRSLKILFSSAIMGCAVYYIFNALNGFSSSLALLISVLSGIIIFSFFLFISRAVNKEMLLVLKRK